MDNDTKLLSEAYSRVNQFQGGRITSKEALADALYNGRISDEEAEAEYPGWYDRLKSDALDDLADEHGVHESTLKEAKKIVHKTTEAISETMCDKKIDFKDGWEKTNTYRWDRTTCPACLKARKNYDKWGNLLKKTKKISESINEATTVRGNGTSLWGDSNGRYKIESMELNRFKWSREYGSLSVYGKDLPWEVYTDEAIEGQVGVLAKRKYPSIESLSWSEQGMQSPGAWNFDVKFRRPPLSSPNYRPKWGVNRYGDDGSGDRPGSFENEEV